MIVKFINLLSFFKDTFFYNYFILLIQNNYYELAFVLFFVAGLTDFFDDLPESIILHPKLVKF